MAGLNLSMSLWIQAPGTWLPSTARGLCQSNIDARFPRCRGRRGNAQDGDGRRLSYRFLPDQPLEDSDSQALDKKTPREISIGACVITKPVEGRRRELLAVTGCFVSGKYPAHDSRGTSRHGPIARQPSPRELPTFSLLPP
jgi:hypothetical protein